MNLNPLRRSEVAVDLDELDRAIADELKQVTKPEPKAHPSPQQLAYAPREVREVREAREKADYSPLQYIGYAITTLTWKDAEAMGAAIADKLGETVGTGGSLTAAIQAWAEGWEQFGPKDNGD